MATLDPGRQALDRSFLTTARGWIAFGSINFVLLAIGSAAARAAPCAPPTPACHLANGKDLLTSDPGRAADELLASYQLDERTDTLALYATALQLDQRYALALETWKRVIVFRDSELEAARDAERTQTGKKRAAARAAAARAEHDSEEAARAILALWPRVGRVRIRRAPGQQVAVARQGAEVDAAEDVLVNAGHDELVFAQRDGSSVRIAVAVAAGGLAQIDAPAERVVAAPPPPPRAPAAAPRPVGSPVLAVSADADQEPIVSWWSRSSTLSKVGLGLAGGAVVVGGVAAGFGILASRDYDRARDAGCTADGRCPFGAAADLARQSNDRARWAQIGAVGAGALAATGVTLWFLGRRAPHHAVSEVALHIAPSSTAISGRF